VKKTIFLFAIHCHQPVGNFEHILEQAYQKSYLPFINVMAKHPRIRFTVHYSGILYDWFLVKHPEFIDLLKKLVKRGQIEVLTGGYYEPILPFIPDVDKLGQIEMSNQFIRDKLGAVPAGLWLTEGVWEPSLPKVLSEAEIEYTLLDEHYFLAAGLSQDKLNGCYLTEDQGKMLKVFPIDGKLLELIPFKTPEETIKYLKSLAKEGNPSIAVFADDGEKFGFRQDNHHWIYEEGYLERLLTSLEENNKDIQTMTFSRYLEEYSALGQIYLPTASYPRMAAGFFRNFLVEFPEANNMHKKMLHVSNKLETLRSAKIFIGGGERDKQVGEIAQELFQGQCSCICWPEFVGGFFHQHLRGAIYEHLIKAEVGLEKFNRQGKEFAEVTVSDLNKDGQDEVIISNSILNLYCAPANGGAIYEIDYKPKAVNLINNLTRNSKPGYCFVDNFLAQGTNLDKFSSGEFKESGDFAGEPYFFMPKRSHHEVSLVLSREGMVAGLPLKVEKQISLVAKQSIIHLNYKITNLGKEQDEFWFGTEAIFSVGQKDLSGIVSGENKVKNIRVVDEMSIFDILLEFEEPTTVWRFPLEKFLPANSQEKASLQGTVIFPNWKFVLAPGESWENKIILRIEE